MRKLILIVIILTLSFIKAKAGLDYNNQCKKAYRLALAFHFQEMDSVLAIEQKADPTNAAVYSVNALAYFLKFSTSEQEIDYKEFKINYDKAIDLLADTEGDNPYKLYLLADLHLQNSFINILQSNFISALIQFKKSYNIIHENAKLYPDFQLNKKLLGLMNIALGSVPKSYTWTLSLINMKGDLDLGNKQLRSLLLVCNNSVEYNYLWVESLAAYSFTKTNYANKKDTSNLLYRIFSDSEINTKYANNQLYAFTKVSFFQHRKLNDKALAALSLIQKELSRNSNQIYYLDYMYGESLLFKADSSSIIYFKRYLNNYPGLNYRKAAFLKMAWSSLLHGDTAAFKTYKKQILHHGAAFFDADKQAQKNAQQKGIPNVPLLQSRLLFDGGYFRQADTILRHSYVKGAYTSPKDELEYIYRLARIYDEMGDAKVAVIYYKMTIKQGRKLPYYFAANSALNLGYHYERVNNYRMAETYYHQCLEMDFDEYQNSITQKAKAGLNRIEKKKE